MPQARKSWRKAKTAVISASEATIGAARAPFIRIIRLVRKPIMERSGLPVKPTTRERAPMAKACWRPDGPLKKS